MVEGFGEREELLEGSGEREELPEGSGEREEEAAAGDCEEEEAGEREVEAAGDFDFEGDEDKEAAGDLDIEEEAAGLGETGIDSRWNVKEKLVEYLKSVGTFKVLVSPAKGSRLTTLIAPCPHRQQVPSPNASSTTNVCCSPLLILTCLVYVLRGVVIEPKAADNNTSLLEFLTSL